MGDGGPVPTVSRTFLALDGPQADYRTARFVILPVPYDGTVSYAPGTRDGPRAVIAASQHIEDYDEELGRESIDAGIATLDPLEPNYGGPRAMIADVARAARRAVRDEKFLIGLGGEHSITLGLVQAVRTRFRRLSVLQIDAHADLRDRYHGSRYSHACVMRRIHERGIAAVGVGIRSYCAEEARFIRRARKPIYSARFCHEDPDWVARVVERLSADVYVTIDIDAFDPACAPGTGTPEPGGLNWFQVTELLAAVARQRRIVAADVVEVRPLPPSNVTEYLAARLIYRLIGLVCA